ncbi:MAG: hypothetical protein V4646_08085 [Pseudomonadota bacterium]
MVLHIDTDALIFRIGGQGNLAAVRRELERVLQQIEHGRKQQFPVGLDRKPQTDNGNRKFAAPGLRFKRCGRLDAGNKVADGNQLGMGGQPGSQADLGQRVVNDAAQADQGAIEHASGGTGKFDLAGFDDADCMRDGVEVVAYFVGKKTQALVHGLFFPVLIEQPALVGKFRHRIGDAIVQATVERAKFGGLDRLLEFGCHVRDGLA